MKISALLTALMAGSAFAVSTVTVTRTIRAAPRTETETRTVTRRLPATTTVSVTRTFREVSTSTSTEVDTTTISATETDTITATSTSTITSTVTTTKPSATPFIGNGNLVVFSSGQQFGHVSKYGGWYTSSSPATYNGIAQSDDGSTFTLTTSQGPCQVLGSGALNCTAANTNTIFGSTVDGNLTFSGSDIFGSAAGPTTNAPGSVIFDGAGQFSLNIQWVSTM